MGLLGLLDNLPVEYSDDVAKHVIIRPHYGGPRHIVKFHPDRTTAVRVVEVFQRNLERRSLPTGVSWRVGPGNLVQALVASTKATGGESDPFHYHRA